MTLSRSDSPEFAASSEFAKLIACLGGDEALNASAREHRALQRVRRVKSAAQLLRLALLYGPGGLSMRSTAALAAEAGLCDISDVALLKRLRRAAPWLEALCATLLEQADHRSQPLSTSGEPAPVIHLVDASVIRAPGQAGRYRLHLCWDATRQRIVGAKITTSKLGERLD